MTVKEYRELIKEGINLLDIIDCKKTYMRNTNTDYAEMHGCHILRIEEYIEKTIEMMNNKEVRE